MNWYSIYTKPKEEDSVSKKLGQAETERVLLLNAIEYQARVVIERAYLTKIC